MYMSNYCTHDKCGCTNIYTIRRLSGRSNLTERPYFIGNVAVPGIFCPSMLSCLFPRLILIRPLRTKACHGYKTVFKIYRWWQVTTLATYNTNVYIDYNTRRVHCSSTCLVVWYITHGTIHHTVSTGSLCPHLVVCICRILESTQSQPCLLGLYGGRIAEGKWWSFQQQCRTGAGHASVADHTEWLLGHGLYIMM